MEEAFDLSGSDSRCSPDSNTLGTIKLRWRESSECHSLQLSSSSVLEIVFALDRPRTIGVLLSEYRAPIATGGLFARDKLHRLSLDANILIGQG